jgi:hypothetical protein
MSEESVRAFFAENAPDIQIEKLDRSSETSWLSAAWNIKPAQIAKTLSLRVGERSVMLVTCGDSRLDNGKIKAVLGGKAKMLRSDEASAITGHTVGHLPVWPGDAAARLLRCAAQGVRPGRHRCGIDALRDQNRARANGGTRRGDMGGCL